MNKTTKTIFSLFLYLTAIFIGIVSCEDRLLIYVEHYGDDIIGKRVNAEIKAKIFSSQKYEIGSNVKQSDFVVSLVSIPVENNSQKSALAIAYVYFPAKINYYTKHEVHVLNFKATKVVANQIFENMKEYIQKYKKVAVFVYMIYDLGLGELEKKKKD